MDIWYIKGVCVFFLKHHRSNPGNSHTLGKYSQCWVTSSSEMGDGGGRAHVIVRGHLVGVNSPLPPGGFQESTHVIKLSSEHLYHWTILITQKLFLKIIIFIVRHLFRAVLRYRQNYKAVDLLLNDPMTEKKVTLKLRPRM